MEDTFYVPQTTCQNQESFATLCPFTNNAFSKKIDDYKLAKMLYVITKIGGIKIKTLLGLIYFGCHGSYYMIILIV